MNALIPASRARNQGSGRDNSGLGRRPYLVAQAARTRADEVLARSPLDNGNIDAANASPPENISRSDSSDDHHCVLAIAALRSTPACISHFAIRFSVGSGRGQRSCGGALGTIRTHRLRFRRTALEPAELWARPSLSSAARFCVNDVRAADLSSHAVAPSQAL